VIFHRGSHQTIKAKKSYIAAFQDRQFWHDPSFFSSIAAGLMVIAPVTMPQKNQPSN
jgi:alpha-N-acetylglucosamine transferase